MSNIVLTGFMGTGKSTVGRLVASRLDWAFVDTDAVIVAAAGKPIPQIFAEEGESAFRALESQVCRDYAQRSGYVIATGGGMLVNPDNRALMCETGVVISLIATPATIRRRLRHDTGRPLFNNDWETLYAQRLSVYQAMPHQIDTSNLMPHDVAEKVIEIWAQEFR